MRLGLKRVLLIASMLVAANFTTGLASEEQLLSKEVDGIKVQLAPKNGSFKIGTNSILVKIQGSNGQPLENADVRVVAMAKGSEEHNHSNNDNMPSENKTSDNSKGVMLVSAKQIQTDSHAGHNMDDMDMSSSTSDDMSMDGMDSMDMGDMDMGEVNNGYTSQGDIHHAIHGYTPFWLSNGQEKGEYVGDIELLKEGKWTVKVVFTEKKVDRLVDFEVDPGKDYTKRVGIAGGFLTLMSGVIVFAGVTRPKKVATEKEAN